MKVGNYIRPLFQVNGREGDKVYINFIGSSFCYKSSKVVITANHVVDNLKKEDIIIFSPGYDQIHCPDEISNHPEADLSVLIFCDSIGGEFIDGFSCYEKTYGIDFFSFGYPGTALNFNGRYFQGYIQRYVNFCFKKYKYEGFELNFSVPKGLSGSPIIQRLINNNKKVASKLLMGMVTSNVSSYTIDSHSEQIEEEDEQTINTGDKMIIINKLKFKEILEKDIISYGVGIDLRVYKNWIDDVLAKSEYNILEES